MRRRLQKFGQNDPLDVNETKQSSWSETEKSSAADVMHKRLLEQLECLDRTVHDVANRMEGKIAHESLKRLEQNQELKEKCVSEWMKGSKMKKVQENWCRMIKRQ